MKKHASIVLFFCIVMCKMQAEEQVFESFMRDGGRIMQRGNIITFFFNGFSPYSDEYGVKKLFDEWQELDVTTLKATADGYYYCDLLGGKYVLLRGGNYIILFCLNKESFKLRTGISTPKGPLDEINKPDWKISEQFYPNKIWTLGIHSIQASSHLTETIQGKKIEYDAKKINEILFIDAYDVYWNKYHLPWVEGKADSGIGETISVEFEKPSDYMLVLNGFVDFERRHLFKSNNRVKKARIRSLDAANPFTVEYEFTDTVEFSCIQFPVKASAVELEILEVYKGEKWDDTAISAIVLNYPNVPSLEETLQFEKRKKLPENQYRP